MEHQGFCPLKKNNEYSMLEVEMGTEGLNFEQSTMGSTALAMSGLKRREPSPALRREPSLYLASCNPHRLTTNTCDVQRCTSVAGGRKPGAATHDPYGNVTEHKKTELGIAYSTKYSYDAADRVLTLTYPDNRVATYTRDILGRITQVSFPVNGTPTVLTQARSYRADGLLAAQTFGNGLAESRTYDQQGRMTTWTLGGETRTYTYDPNGNVATRTLPTETRTYVYDPEDRLTEDRITAGSGSTNTMVYDLNGNRTKLNTTAYLYAANSNRLTKVGTKAQTLDPAGNTTKDNLNYNYTYNANGTLKEARSGTTLKGTYTYNHRFQRTRKVAGSTTTVYHYDLDGHLLAETTPTGVLTRAYVRDDEAPIAQLTRTTTDTLHYLHPDQLGTPRLATDAARSTVWRYDGNAFGQTLPTGTLTVNLRFPGQYYDAETKLFYNWHRYYDPRLGRYVTSDPIGLEGGLNTYTYVENNPLRYTDPTGLFDPTTWVEPAVKTVTGIGTGIATSVVSVVVGVMWPSKLGAHPCEMPGGPPCGPTSPPQNCPPDGGGNSKDPCKGLRDQLNQHIRKLQEFMSDPYGHDNQGHLANNPSERHKNIIEGRIRKLRGQIDNFRRLLEECERKHGKR
jgi:RHS repeat-associated protein